MTTSGIGLLPVIQGISVMLFNKLEVSLGVLAYRTDGQRCSPFMGMPAVAASPAYRFVFGKEAPGFKLLEQGQVAVVVLAKFSNDCVH